MTGKEVFYLVLVLVGMSGALFAIISVVTRVIRQSIHEEVHKLEADLIEKFQQPRLHGKTQ